MSMQPPPQADWLDDLAKAERHSARRREISQALAFEAAFGGSAATAVGAFIVQLLILWGELRSPASEAELATLLIVFPMMALAGAVISFVGVLFVNALGGWALCLAARVMAAELTPRWCATLASGWTAGLVGLFFGAAPRGQPMSLTAYLAVVAALVAAGQFGAIRAVERAIARQPSMSRAYAEQAPTRFNLRNLLGFTTVVAVIFAVLGSLHLPWQLGALGLWVVVVQGATIAALTVGRRYRST